MPNVFLYDQALPSLRLFDTTSSLLQGISPSSIVSLEAFGSLTVSLSGSGAQILLPAGLASAETFGSATLVPTFTVQATSIASGEVIGSATIKSVVALSPSGIGSAGAIGAPTLKASYTISLTGIASAEAIGLSVVTGGSGGGLVLNTTMLYAVAQVLFKALGFVSVSTPSSATLEVTTKSNAVMQILATNTAVVVVFQKATAVVTVYSEGNPVTSVVRGSTVAFKVNFTDDLGAPINPSQASVFVSYPDTTGTRTTTEIVLTQSGNDWTASFDTGISKPGEITWSAQTKLTTPAAAVDGSFTVTANSANPENLA
jgi:hypothetical protein